jgi:hypothetical protein
MSIFGSITSHFTSKAEMDFGLGERFPLTKQIAAAVRTHSIRLASADLSSFKFERRRSEHPDAKADLVIYDGSANPVLFGREMSAGMSFWAK